MPNGTFEEAKACPKCSLTGQQGRITHLKPGSGVTRGARLIEFICKNKRCRWYNTPWEVQVNPDGTIPDPNAHREKKYAKPSEAMAAQAKNYFENLQNMTTVEGAEVRNR